MLSAHWKRRAAAGIAVLATALPGTAWPYTLDELLVMPFDKLLTLHFTPAPAHSDAVPQGRSHAR